MRKTLLLILLVSLSAVLPGTVCAQIVSAGNGSWTEGATWVGGVSPDSLDNVVINAGDTITVDNFGALCNSLSFGDYTAQIKMAENSRLNVYGNFTLAADSHCVFDEQWSSTDAKIRFAGSAIQALSGWSTTGGSTSFRDVIIDKTGGKVMTGGNNMRLGIQNSLEIINGIFELSVGDDIEGRWATSGLYVNQPKPDVVIHAGCEFETIDGSGAHHIRSYYDTGTGASSPIGVWTVYGQARFRDGSTIKYNFSGMDIEAGGKVITSTGNAGGQLEFGPIHVKAGGEVENYTTSDIYGPTVTFTLDAGALFDTKSTTTIFPASFINNGTVRYSRDSSTQQVITDMDYVNLRISIDDAFNKLWTLGGDRLVTGDLIVDDDGMLILAAAADQTLTVNGQLDLTEGYVDATDPEAAIVLGPAAVIAESDTTVAQGTVKTTRTVSQSVNETFGGLGFELYAAGAAPGITDLTRETGTALSIDGTPSITRYFDVAPANNTGLDATVVFHYNEAELNGTAESNLKNYWTDIDRLDWTPWTSTVDESGNTVTTTGYPYLMSTVTAGPVSATSVEDDGTPRANRLSQNYPNPFNPQTTISFSLKAKGQVSLRVYDAAGRLVRTLVDDVLSAGSYSVEWNGRSDNGSPVASGVYFYRIAAGDFLENRKMVLLR